MPRVYRSAELSPDRKYRRRLDRWWAEGPRVAWLMCNPSLADEVRDDPTVRKCVGFTMRWGFPGLTIINPFDLVCTNPADLVLSQYPATLQNGIAIGKVARAARLLVVAWGCEDTIRKMAKRGLDPLMTLMYIHSINLALPIRCFGLTSAGTPRHPSRLPDSTLLEPFEWKANAA